MSSKYKTTDTFLHTYIHTQWRKNNLVSVMFILMFQVSNIQMNTTKNKTNI